DDRARPQGPACRHQGGGGAEPQAQADRGHAQGIGGCRPRLPRAGLERQAADLTSDFLLSLAQAVAKGLLTGMVYGLMALGLSVIFGVMRVVNFAYGEMMVVGMYLAWTAFSYADVSPILSLPLIALLFF